MAFHEKLLSLLNEHTIIPFNKLTLPTLIKIGALTLKEVTENFMKEKDITIKYSDYDSFVSLLTISLAPYLNARHIKQKIPKLMFSYIYDALKAEENITQITFKIAKKAKLFLKEILDNQELFISNTTEHHKTVKLDFKISSLNSQVTCNIKNALYVEEKLSVSNLHKQVSTSSISFEDVAGHKKVKKELNEIISLLKDPKKLQHFNLNIPKGMFLYGPVGMGKKLLAQAFSHEAKMPFITLSGSALFDKEQIHTAYVKAYKNAPAIVIFEDIDTQGFVGGMISTMSVEPILKELDALQQSFDSPIFTILTLSSNDFPPELLQANRIDIQIEFPKLDMEARRY